MNYYKYIYIIIYTQNKKKKTDDGGINKHIPLTFLVILIQMIIPNVCRSDFTLYTNPLTFI